MVFRMWVKLQIYWNIFVLPAKVSEWGPMSHKKSNENIIEIKAQKAKAKNGISNEHQVNGMHSVQYRLSKQKL